MSLRGPFAALSTLLVAASVSAECGVRLNQSSFHIELLCPAGKPCVAGRPVTFELQTDTCARFLTRCAPYTIDSCDTLTWHFNQGSPLAATITVTGTNRVEYTLPSPEAGTLTPTVELRNDRDGTYVSSATRILPRDPPAFVNWATPELVVWENAGEVNVDLVRSGFLDRTFPVFIAGDPNVRTVRDLPFVGLHYEFDPGTARIPISLYPYNDGVFRGDLRKTVMVYSDPPDFRDPNAAAIGDYSSHQQLQVYIVEDDPGPLVQIAPIEVDEGDDPTPRTVKTPITVSQPLTRDLVVASEDGTVRGSIPKGATRGTVSFTYQPDRSRDGDTSMTIPVSPFGPPVTFGGRAQLIVHIRDDDPYRLAPASKTVRALSSFSVVIGRGDQDPAPLMAELSSSAPDIVSVPRSIGIPASLKEVPFGAQALRAGTAVITARFPDGKLAATTIVVADQPSIRSVTPSSGYGGQAIRIDGQNLTADCRITFGGVSATSQSFRDGALYAVVRHGSAGLVDVTATCAGGTARLRDAFTTLHRRRSTSH